MGYNRFFGKQWLVELGYTSVIANPMEEQIESWWGWYTATSDFFSSVQRVGKRTFKVKRISIKPAKMVCEDWASLLFNERTTISLEGQVDLDDGEDSTDPLAQTNDWLQAWLKTSRFMRLANRTVERAMALGTAAWALRIDDVAVDGTASPDARIVPVRYDARYIVPLAWDGDTCTECLFRSVTVIDGKEVNQLQVHRKGPRGTYELHTALFNAAGKRLAAPESIAEYFDSGSATPTFALVRPGIDNAYLEFHPFGVSVFDAAQGAVTLTDTSVDNLNRDVYLGQKLVFIPDAMLEKDDTGNATIPRAEDQQVFCTFETSDSFVDDKKLGPWEYNPDMRVEDNRLAIKTALELLGKRCGFGDGYYTLDEHGGVSHSKTATEVASDASELMRNINKHQDMIAPAIEGICAAAVEVANAVYGLNLADISGKVNIIYADNIIEDDAVLRERDRADVAAGLLEAWKYMVRWQGYSEADAKAFALAASMGAGMAGSGGGSSLNGAQMSSLMAIMAQYAAGDISEGQAVNLISTAIGIDKAAAKRLLDGDLADMLVDAPAEV